MILECEPKASLGAGVLPNSRFALRYYLSLRWSFELEARPVADNSAQTALEGICSACDSSADEAAID